MGDDLFVYGRDSLRARSYFSAEQRGICPICKTEPVALVLDHEHTEKGLCRGLLCAACNHGLGFFADDPARLAAAVDYLAAHAERNARYEATSDWDERRVKVTGSDHPVARLNSYHRRVRDDQIRAAAQAGEAAQTIASRFDVSLSLVYSVCREST